MNSELYDKKYPIPLPIIKELKAKLMSSNDLNGEGVKRAKFLVNNGYATYQMLKRIKNFFDNFDQTSDSLQEYELSGGDNMRSYIDHTLDADRSSVKRSHDIKRPLRPNMKLGLKTPSMTESTIRMIKEEEEESPKLDINVVVVVFNEEKRILLLKRSTYPDQWMPNMFSLPGGKVEKGEDPNFAAKRELKEETGIIVNNFLEKFVIQRENNVEHVFISIFKGDVFNIKLDREHQGYGWFGYNEIKFLQTVPNLEEYIKIAVSNYE